MHILDITLNKPIKSLTAKDLKRLCAGGYINANYLTDIRPEYVTSDKIVFSLFYPNIYTVGLVNMRFIADTFTLGDLTYDNVFTIHKPLIIKGLKRLANWLAHPENATLNEIIRRLQHESE